VKMFDADKNRMIGEKTMNDDMLSRFHVIPERYWWMDGQTDGQILYNNISSVCWRAI